MERADTIWVNWPDREQHVIEGESLETLSQNLMPILQTYDREVADLQSYPKVADARSKQLGAQVCALKEASAVVMEQLDRPVTFRAFNDLVAELTDGLSERHELARVHGVNACSIAIHGLIKGKVFDLGPDLKLTSAGPLPDA